MADKKPNDNNIAKDSPFALFETDPDVERQGIELDYGNFYITVARAGGANDRFRRTYNEKTKQHQRAMATNTLPEEVSKRLANETFAESVVMGWGSAKHGDGKIEWRDGTVRDYSVDAVKELFVALPDLAIDVMQQAQNQALFRRTIAENDAKN